MIPTPIDLFSIAVRSVAIVAFVIGGLWLVDAIGDQREAKVWGEINAALERTNAKIDAQANLDEKIAQVAEQARKKALEEALKLPAVAIQCPANSPQADALNKIR